MRIAIAGGTGLVGSHIVDAARQRGHEPIVLGRSHGIDVVAGDGLHSSLASVDVVIDVMNAESFEEGPATEFFTTAAGNLQRAAGEQGIGHIVTLSIVGIDGTSFGYYKAKLAQGRAAVDGPVPSTIQRATQFHEFPAQMLAAMRDGDHASMFDVRVQTVAARTVADALLAVAEQPPAGRVPDLAGPQPGSLVDLARAFAARHAPSIEITADTETMSGLAQDELLPTADARLEGPTFEQWLTSDDAAALALTQRARLLRLLPARKEVSRCLIDQREGGDIDGPTECARRAVTSQLLPGSADPIRRTQLQAQRGRPPWRYARQRGAGIRVRAVGRAVTTPWLKLEALRATCRG
jgi:uncharacterized protein YbjT (DUF2867 family)